MVRNSAGSGLLLALAAFIWGLAFVAQSAGMEYVGAFTFNAVRFIIGGIVLIPVILFLDRRRIRKSKITADISEKGNSEKDNSKKYSPGADNTAAVSVSTSDRAALTGGILCGLALFAASSFQQVGIAYTTAGKAGFITAMYIVIVPILGIFLGRHPGWTLLLSVAVAVAGLYLLCINSRVTVGFGDVLEFICAIFFAVQIMLVDHYSVLTEGVKLSCVQFFVCGFLSLIFALLLETIDISAIFMAWAPILYTGVFSCGIAYTLQIVGQKNTDPQIAALIMSLESVFALISGWIILGQAMSARELIGCVLMFLAIILARIHI